MRGSCHLSERRPCSLIRSTWSSDRTRSSGRTTKDITLFSSKALWCTNFDKFVTRRVEAVGMDFAVPNFKESGSRIHETFFRFANRVSADERHRHARPPLVARSFRHNVDSVGGSPKMYSHSFDFEEYVGIRLRKFFGHFSNPFRSFKKHGSDLPRRGTDLMNGIGFIQ